MANKTWWECEDEEELIRRVDDGDPARTAWHVEKILCNIPSGQNALEIGAGYGRLIPGISYRFAHVEGVDSSRTLVTLAQQRSMRVQINDGRTLPYNNDSFDFIYSYTVFHHILDLTIIKSYIAETERVLKPGGLARMQALEGPTDGYQFENVDEFAGLFEDVGLALESLETCKEPWDRDLARIWVTARKI